MDNEPKPMTEERLKRIEDGNEGSVQPDRTIRDLCAKVRETLLQIDELRKKLLKVAVHCDFPEHLLGRPCGGNDETCKCRCAQCMLAKQNGRGELFIEN
jgi:hypothetical protein